MGIFDVFKKGQNTTNQSTGSTASREEKTFTFARLPQNLEELKALPESALTDRFATAALTVLALNVYPENPEASFAMIDFLRGPDPMTTFQKQFLKDRFMDGKNYLLRSYMEGATVDNNYEPSLPYRITVMSLAHSNDSIGYGYVTLYIQSAGADSPRGIRLRTKPSTGQWFVNVYDGLLAGIRIPKADDPWA